MNACFSLGEIITLPDFLNRISIRSSDVAGELSGLLVSIILVMVSI